MKNKDDATCMLIWVICKKMKVSWVHWSRWSARKSETGKHLPKLFRIWHHLKRDFWNS